MNADKILLLNLLSHCERFTRQVIGLFEELSLHLRPPAVELRLLGSIWRHSVALERSSLDSSRTRSANAAVCPEVEVDSVQGG